jgi:hypothetical protein
VRERDAGNARDRMWAAVYQLKDDTPRCGARALTKPAWTWWTFGAWRTEISKVRSPRSVVADDHPLLFQFLISLSAASTPPGRCPGPTNALDSPQFPLRLPSGGGGSERKAQTCLPLRTPCRGSLLPARLDLIYPATSARPQWRFLITATTSLLSPRVLERRPSRITTRSEQVRDRRPGQAFPHRGNPIGHPRHARAFHLGRLAPHNAPFKGALPATRQPFFPAAGIFERPPLPPPPPPPPPRLPPPSLQNGSLAKFLFWLPPFSFSCLSPPPPPSPVLTPILAVAAFSRPIRIPPTDLGPARRRIHMVDRIPFVPFKKYPGATPGVNETKDGSLRLLWDHSSRIRDSYRYPTLYFACHVLILNLKRSETGFTNYS